MKSGWGPLLHVILCLSNVWYLDKRQCPQSNYKKRHVSEISRKRLYEKIQRTQKFHHCPFLPLQIAFPFNDYPYKYSSTAFYSPCYRLIFSWVWNYETLFLQGLSTHESLACTLFIYQSFCVQEFWLNSVFPSLFFYFYLIHNAGCRKRLAVA